MSKQIQHVITIRKIELPDLSRSTRYRPVCSCGRYSAGLGWTHENAESRGRAHVKRAAAADARRAGIIARAVGEPLVRRAGGRHRAGGRS